MGIEVTSRAIGGGTRTKNLDPIPWSEPVIVNNRRCPQCGGTGCSKGGGRMRCRTCGKTWYKEEHYEENL